MTSQHGLTRRDFLKRGAVLGGTLAWVTPAVQVIGLRPVLAQTVSPVCGAYYAVKIDPDEGTENNCVDISGQTEPTGAGQCLDVDESGITLVADGCSHVTSVTTPDGSDWTVVLDLGYQFGGEGQAWVKSGSDVGFCVEGATWNAATRTITFPYPGQDISNVQFVFCEVI